MAHPMTHAISSARRFGGEPEDYLPIHDLMDSSKAVFPDNRHRALTHNSWFFFIVEKVFGHEIELTCATCNKERWIKHDNGSEESCPDCRTTRTAKVRYICEQHVLEDYGGKYIPTAGDYLEGMEFQPWMNNGVEGAPTSHRLLSRQSTKTKRRAVTLD